MSGYPFYRNVMFLREPPFEQPHGEHVCPCGKTSKDGSAGDGKVSRASAMAKVFYTKHKKACKVFF